MLNCYCWSKLAYEKIKKADLIFEDSGRDDTGIFIFKSDIQNLPELLKLSGMIKNRMSINSNKRKQFENRLGHEIHRCELDHSTWKAIQLKNTYGIRPNIEPKNDYLWELVSEGRSMNKGSMINDFL